MNTPINVTKAFPTEKAKFKTKCFENYNAHSAVLQSTFIEAICQNVESDLLKCFTVIIQQVLP